MRILHARDRHGARRRLQRQGGVLDEQALKRAWRHTCVRFSSASRGLLRSVAHKRRHTMSVANLRKASCIGRLNIDPADDYVVVTSGKVEIGQHIDRALRASGGVGIGLQRVVSRPASTHYSPDGYTAGSNSIEQSGVALRLACRALLEVSQARAARRLNAAVAEVRYTGNGEFQAARGCAGCVVGTLGCWSQPCRLPGRL